MNRSIYFQAALAAALSFSVAAQAEGPNAGVRIKGDVTIALRQDRRPPSVTIGQSAAHVCHAHVPKTGQDIVGVVGLDAEAAPSPIMAVSPR